MLANISLSNSQNHNNVGAVVRPNLTEQPEDFQSELLEGFIKHPKRFPLNFRRLRFWQSAKIEINQDSNTGLTFSSKEYQKPGSIIEVTIPTRKEVHHFMGKVVMVKESDDSYEIGIWLVNAEDAPKLRIVEQICHIELYLNDKRYKEGPFLSPEKLTEEWISRFASGFPVS
ncbi:MAG: hypothetical protein HND53_09890 [Proteobacteria bacterium]|nr:hypothetical protein [Pseudomonadota bacterium]NOG60799.1 hypothetical protein [Pseudomonadota bacterium]